MMRELARGANGPRPAWLALILGTVSAAIQVAKLHGALVVTNASTAAKRQKGLDLGADAIVDYTVPDWSAEVHRIANGVGVHLAIDNVGGAVFEESWKALRPGGKLITCGTTTGGRVTIDLALRAQTSLETSFSGSRGDLTEIVSFFASGQLHAVNHAVLPFEQVQEGHRMMLDRESFGKIVLTW